VARFGSGTVVTALTASALALVTLLAVQAKSSAQTTNAGGAKPGPSASASAGASARPSALPKPVAVPAHSGTGRRVVYSLAAKRVWLVDPAKPATDRTYTVQPSTVQPPTGSYHVTRSTVGPYTGSDGVKIKNGVLFTSHAGVTIGFSSAVDGTTPAPDPTRKTGGIRETLGDGQALFDFAPLGTKVVVVA
jgi:hypothetical protein